MMINSCAWFLIICFLLLLPNVDSISQKTQNKLERQPPQFVIDLDVNPFHRWDNVTKHYNSAGPVLNQFLKVFRKRLIKTSKYYNDLIRILRVNLNLFLGRSLAQELRGLSKSLNIKVERLLLSNLLYEFNAFDKSTIKACTSIIAQNDKNDLYHGRNLDYTGATYLRDFTIQVDFQRKGKTVYKAVTMVGLISVPTGVKPGAFTITGNQRNTGTLLDNVISAIYGSTMNFVLTRQILETAETFEEALYRLSTSQVIAPMYYIVGGTRPNQAAIIVRDPLKTVTTVTLRNQHIYPWFLAQTNYEPWKNPPKYDNRRSPISREMEKVGRHGFSSKEMKKVLSVRPILHSGTVHTVLMEAKSGNITTYIRYDAPFPNDDL